MTTVTITVEGGVIQHIDVPDQVRVVVYDYDADGCDDERAETDSDGNRRIATVWEHQKPCGGSQ